MLKANNKLVGIIGCGNLGESLASMLLNNNKKVVCSVRREERLNELKHSLNYKDIKFKRCNWEVAKMSNSIILSVKPTQIRKVCTEISPFVKNNKQIISVAAAVPLYKLSKWLPKGTNIIRTMPNVLCETGNGVVPYISNNDNLEIMEEIFGENLLIKLIDDKQLDIATLISGCGPAFLSWFSLANSKIGENLIPKEILKDMISTTMIGTGLMLTKLSNEELINKVASPGGATEAALQKLSILNTDDDINQALSVAYNRIISLSKDL